MFDWWWWWWSRISIASQVEEVVETTSWLPNQRRAPLPAAAPTQPSWSRWWQGRIACCSRGWPMWWVRPWLQWSKGNRRSLRTWWLWTLRCQWLRCWEALLRRSSHRTRRWWRLPSMGGLAASSSEQFGFLWGSIESFTMQGRGTKQLVRRSK